MMTVGAGVILVLLDHDASTGWTAAIEIKRHEI